MDLLDVSAAAVAIDFDIHGIDITVTVPNGDPVETRGTWLPPIDDGTGVLQAFTRSGPKRLMAIARTELEAVPKGSVIVATERDGADPVTFVADLKGEAVDPYRIVVQLLVKEM